MRPLPLQALLEGNPQFVYPASRRNEVLGWVQSGVRDFSISRAATQWGIKFPQDPKQTVYVWFDALNGYLSGEHHGLRLRHIPDYRQMMIMHCVC